MQSTDNLTVWQSSLELSAEEIVGTFVCRSVVRSARSVPNCLTTDRPPLPSDLSVSLSFLLCGQQAATDLRSARAVLLHPRPHRPSAHCAHQRTPTFMQATAPARVPALPAPESARAPAPALPYAAHTQHLEQRGSIGMRSACTRIAQTRSTGTSSTRTCHSIITLLFTSFHAQARSSPRRSPQRAGACSTAHARAAHARAAHARAAHARAAHASVAHVRAARAHAHPTPAHAHSTIMRSTITHMQQAHAHQQARLRNAHTQRTATQRTPVRAHAHTQTHTAVHAVPAPRTRAHTQHRRRAMSSRSAAAHAPPQPWYDGVVVIQSCVQNYNLV